MADKPILFSAPMVRALLEGRKTQTRRVLPVDPAWHLDPTRETAAKAGYYWFSDDPELPGSLLVRARCALGDRLWVRESFMPAPMESPPDEPRTTRWNIAYGAGGQAEIMAPAAYNPMLYNYERWSPSIHMPRWASRLTLIVTDVRIQRLNDITRGDAMAEGCPFPNMQAGPDPRDWFRDLWASLHGPDAWGQNPFVAVYGFTAHHSNIDRMDPANA